MSIVRPRSHSSNSPDPAGWQGVGVGVVGGTTGNEHHGQFRYRRDSLPSLGATPGNNPPMSTFSSHPKGLDRMSSGTPPRFAMTPAEFNLSPSTQSNSKPQNAESERQGECFGVGHLSTLRSAAFWELRRSIIENGEGLIRRMRDYEQSRSRHPVGQKAKERRNRVRKSSALRSRCNACPNSVSEASDEDDVLIFSEDTSEGVSRWSPLVTRARSFDSMDIDGQDQDHPGSRSVEYRHERMPFADNTLGTHKTETDSEPLLSSPDSVSPTPSSSSISLPLPQSISMTSSLSEKALADLNVALTNGACSITDYSPIWTYQQQFNTDEHDTGYGDLWR